MEQFDGNYHDFTDAGAQQADATMLVRFYKKPLKDDGASQREGRPIFKDVDYIEIRAPGAKDWYGDVYRPYKHGQRFGHHYDRWKQTEEQPEVAGTPLKEWGGVQASQIKELEYFNIHTVEQLAAMADTEAGKFMNGQSLKRAASEYIENNRGAAHVAEVKAELAEKDAQMLAMQEQMAAMQAQMEELQKPKRGRPRKKVDESDGNSE